MPLIFKDIKTTLGSDKINNKFLEKKYKWKKNKIFNKTGIKSRFRSNKNQTVETLAISALMKLKKKNNLDKVSFLVFVSNTAPLGFPSMAHQLSSKIIDNENIFSFSINSGCTGFVDALILISNLLNKDNKQAIIVTSDTYTKYLDSNDKGTNSIFSDGASATLLEYSSKGYSIVKKIISQKKSSCKSLQMKNNKIFMNGPEVLLFSINDVMPNLKKLIKNNTLVLIHQAGKIIIDNIKTHIKKNYIMPTNFSKYGNLISTSIPKLIEDNFSVLKKNNNILISGFGVGLSQSHILLNKNYKK